jgi:hypothetical protein
MKGTISSKGRGYVCIICFGEAPLHNFRYGIQIYINPFKLRKFCII